MTVRVDLDNFVRAETAFQFDRIVAAAGGVNRWFYVREPVPVDEQKVIRMQRDTLYAAMILDVSAGAELTLPDTGGRYRSIQVINEDHYTNAVLHKAGTHVLTVDEYDTPYLYLIMRILVNPQDEEDVKAVHRLQDSTLIKAGSTVAYAHPDYDESSYQKLYRNILALGEAKPDALGSFGSKDQVNPIRHLIDTAVGWGGLPEDEAFYMNDTIPRPTDQLQLHLREVPADAFWSLSIYNADGYFEANPYDSYNMNSVIAEPDEDGSFTLNLAPEQGDLANYLHVMDGWNYVFRLYRPHREVIEGTWQLPEFVPVKGD